MQTHNSLDFIQSQSIATCIFFLIIIKLSGESRSFTFLLNFLCIRHIHMRYKLACIVRNRRIKEDIVFFINNVSHCLYYEVSVNIYISHGHIPNWKTIQCCYLLSGASLITQAVKYMLFVSIWIISN